MASLKQFLSIKQVHNDGIRMAIPDYPGLPKDQWLLVRGKESDAYRAADLRRQRAVGKFFAEAMKDVHESKADAKFTEAQAAWAETREVDSVTEVAAACVSAWSLEDECTQENVLLFLNAYPSTRDAVIATVNRVEGFQIGVSSNSADTPNGCSDSSSQPETRETSGSTSRSSGEQPAPSPPS